MKAAGTECRLEVWEGMWHDFQMYPSKSAAQAMQNAAHFLIEEPLMRHLSTLSTKHPKTGTENL